jgi:hypothetical protein
MQPNAAQHSRRHAILPASFQKIRQHLANDVIFVLAGQVEVR